MKTPPEKLVIVGEFSEDLIWHTRKWVLERPTTLETTEPGYEFGIVHSLVLAPMLFLAQALESAAASIRRAVWKRTKR